MGTKRVEGRPKKKSIRSKVTSKDGLKKRLSRMGKKIKQGLMGPSTDFMTRSAVLKKLQITLKDFRRLCILKGIYPRVPEKAPPKGSDKVYYDIKDITYLSHEPLLDKFREFKTFMKKIRREAGRYQYGEARRRNEFKPIMSLNHLVKERYPRFIDALRDLDDCLSMVHLFSALPSVGRVTSEKTRSCNELVRYWQYYVARTRSLQKVFVSIKGVYFQANILGESITWLVPHQFAQAVPKEVDMRVMVTFLEFYEVFLKFTLFKLYNLQGLEYPPRIDKKLNEAGCFLLSVRVNTLDGSGLLPENTVDTELIQPPTRKAAVVRETVVEDDKMKSLIEKINKIAAEEEDEEDDDDLDNPNLPSISGPLTDSFQGLLMLNDAQDNNETDEEERKTFAIEGDISEKESESRLFSNLKFFINREVPLEWMQLCIIAFGGQVGWDGPASPYTVDDAGITHHIIDRPIQGQQNKSREYIQPQWVFDSINAKFLLPVQRYLAGAILPPHLSPFVDDSKEGYIPKYREEILKLKSSLEAQTVSTAHSQEIEELEEDSDVDDDDDERNEETYQSNIRSEKKSKKIEIQNEDIDEQNVNSITDTKAVSNSKKSGKGVVHKPSNGQKSEDEEVTDLTQIMMSKKTKRLYSRMQYGLKKKQDLTNRLEEKRKQLDSTEVNSTETTAGKKRKKNKN